MVPVRTLCGIEMRHQVDYAMAPHDALTGDNRDVMTGFDGLLGIYFKMYIDDDHVAHHARTQIMNAKNAGRFHDGLADGHDFLIVCRSIHEVV